MRVAILGFMILLLAPVVDLVAAETLLSLESRVGRLEGQLKAIEADMSKLDVISESLQALRNEDLRKIQRDIHGAKETADRRSAEDGNSKGAAVAENSELSDLQPKAADAAPQSTSADGLAERQTLLSRTETLDESVAAIQRRLGSQLDDIAEQLHVIRGEDLAKIHRDIRGASETVDRSVKVPDRSAADGGSKADVAKQGTVIINNQTSQSYWVTINGVRQTFSPGTTSIKVPYGPIRAGLPGFEDEREWPATHWQKIGDAYQITLDLKDRQ